MKNQEVVEFIELQWARRTRPIKDAADGKVRYVCERKHFEAAIRDTLRHAASIADQYGGLDGAYCASTQLRNMADGTFND